MDKEDQEILRQSQRNWITFRDGEIELIRKLAKEKYSGGGTIQGIIVGIDIQDLTKKRVIELYQHLASIINL